ncbi:S41 family peptidase [Candidatus Bealeia paramacronuclearis]|uniref:Tricorn protease homolog n=1 Tax=Candidatus Bealeia paramacronuclearis TaxID=1921001 RepID=A0ABZ2C4R8_9PROT|nr:S41 family peptidase [Candidatus Bealeia paramacronuclearis]
MSHKGYYRSPALFQDQLIFVSEDDLWRVSKEGGKAERLTNGLGQASNPAISPDGKWIAFTGQEEGHAEVYLMPAQGGPLERLTYINEGAVVIGWREDGKIIYATQRPAAPLSLPHPWVKHLYLLNPLTKVSERIQCGPAESISFYGSAHVIQRHGYGYVSWKRYRGGSKAELWIDQKGQGNYEKLIDLPSNTLQPLWLGGEIYFLSDHEGIGNVYGILPNGKNLRAITTSKDFFVRDVKGWGRELVYMAGSDLYHHDLDSGKSRKVEILFPSQRTQRQRKFASPQKYFKSYDLDKKGQRLGIISRGRPFAFGNWEGAANQYGIRDGVKYNHLIFRSDEKHVLMTRDHEGSDVLEEHLLDHSAPEKRFSFQDLGRISHIQEAPQGDLAAITNHRCEVILLNLKTQKKTLLGRSPHGLIYGISWSPDGRYLAYDSTISPLLRAVFIYDVKTKKTHQVTKPVLEDVRPAFDPEGNYLYFLSKRIYNPVMDTMQFDYSFPKGMKPYLLTLRKDVNSPFIPILHLETKKDEGEEKKKKTDEKIKPIVIDFEGIEDRILEFPVCEGDYKTICGIHGKALYTTAPLEGTLDEGDEEDTAFTLRAYDFANQKEELLVSRLSSFSLSGDRTQLAYVSQKKIRVIKAGEKPSEHDHSYKNGGWIDWGRIKISVDPALEWRQMFEEAWRLQKDFYWTADMSKVDWNGVFKKYEPLLDRISTRGELNDLISEMQGELGCSHAYVYGGDLRFPPNYPIGELACDFEWDEKAQGYRITNLAKGDPWIKGATSPLRLPGVQLKTGDFITSINGQKLSSMLTPQQLLVNQTENFVELGVLPKGHKKHRKAVVKTLTSQSQARYRDWVEENRKIISEKTHGNVGYIHIPDMSSRGFSEFHRSFMAELDRPGLIVDVRYNGGGHVSQILLEKLARRRLGYDETRWFGQIPYPANAPMGPMVGLTNEYAGSDGDMFSHVFKVMKLGPLIGKRTWGGVIGIWPRHPLLDGGGTSQPEFSAWFPEIGWSIENHGVDPDIEVEITPQDYEKGFDPQLERAILEVEKIRAEFEPLKLDLSTRPNLEKLGR